MNEFFERVKNNDSPLCVGLDPDMDRIPKSIKNTKTPLADFLIPIIDSTADLVCAYKPNIAFFEAHGVEGIEQLISVVEYIRNLDMDIPVILDAKRGDIGNTARMYARAVFDRFGADAVTVSPYMGVETLTPFSEHGDKGIFVLCLTSNPGYTEFETLRSENLPLYVHVARKVSVMNTRGNLGLVVGATHPEEATQIRVTAPYLPFLMPGIGAQGGDPASIMRIGTASNGYWPIVNSSRSILYAGAGDDFAEKAREAAIKTKEKLEGHLSK